METEPPIGMSLIDKVAAALANAQRHRAGLHSLPIKELKYPSFSWANAVDDAKAAIAAMGDIYANSSLSIHSPEKCIQTVKNDTSGDSREICVITPEKLVAIMQFSGHPKYLDNPLTDSEKGLLRDTLHYLQPYLRTAEPVVSGRPVRVQHFIDQLCAGLNFIGIKAEFPDHCQGEIRISNGVRHTQMRLPNAD